MNKPNNMLSCAEIIDILKKLKLTTMANDFIEINEAPQYQELDFEERMGAYSIKPCTGFPAIRARFPAVVHGLNSSTRERAAI